MNSKIIATNSRVMVHITPVENFREVIIADKVNSGPVIKTKG
jgi:hypothetical protein